MSIVTRVRLALQSLLDSQPEQLNAQHPVVRRHRIFTPASLVRTFVLGFLHRPDASDEHLAQIAAQAGAPVTPQAIAHRHTTAFAHFLEHLVRHALTTRVAAQTTLAPILDRFTGVVLLDSTTVTLPDDLADRFPGCGGRTGSGAAAIKLQTELDLKTGVLHGSVEAGRQTDAATPRQHAPHARGTLRITDLGYFCLSVFAAMMTRGEHFLSRLRFAVTVRLTTDSAPLNLLKWLAHHVDSVVDVPVVLGAESTLSGRLIAWRVPPEVAQRRRRRLHATHQRKWGRPPSVERLAWCDWSLLITDLPADRLSVTEAAVLYRSRWQIELLFKRWKSQDRLALLDSNAVRTQVRLWSRLLAAVLQQWLLVASAWDGVGRSWWKVGEAIRTLATRFASARTAMAIEEVIRTLIQIVAKTCRRNPRAKLGTFELLNQPHRNDFQ